MSYETIIRAWKDETYYNSLSEAERALLPENPVGTMSLSDQELGIASEEKVSFAILCSAVIGHCH